MIRSELNRDAKEVPLAFFSYRSVAVCGCNANALGANGTLYGGSDLDNAVRGMYVPRERAVSEKSAVSAFGSKKRE